MSEVTSRVTTSLIRPAALMALGALFVLSGCVGMGGGMQTHELGVTVSDAAVRLDHVSAAPGMLQVHVVNRGSRARSVVIAATDSGKAYATTSAIAPGDVTDIEVDLPAGAYLLYAETGGRREPGMQAALSVEAARNEGGASTTMGGYY